MLQKDMFGNWIELVPDEKGEPTISNWRKQMRYIPGHVCGECDHFEKDHCAFNPGEEATNQGCLVFRKRTLTIYEYALGDERLGVRLRTKEPENIRELCPEDYGYLQDKHPCKVDGSTCWECWEQPFTGLEEEGEDYD